MDEKRDVPQSGNVPFFLYPPSGSVRTTWPGNSLRETVLGNRTGNGARQHAAGKGTRKAGRPVLRMPRLSSPGIVRCSPTAASGPMLRPMNYSSSGSFMLW